MDSHYEVDIARLGTILHSHDVILMRFDLVEKRLLVDLRASNSSAPLITLLDPQPSFERRLGTIRSLRPDLPAPGGIRILRWPRYVASLRSLGFWDQLVQRCHLAGFPELDSHLDQVFDQLQAEEHRTMRAVIQGDGYTTVWERTA